MTFGFITNAPKLPLHKEAGWIHSKYKLSDLPTGCFARWWRGVNSKKTPSRKGEGQIEKLDYHANQGESPQTYSIIILIRKRVSTLLLEIPTNKNTPQKQYKPESQLTLMG